MDLLVKNLPTLIIFYISFLLKPMFNNLCNIYFWQRFQGSLKLEPAWAAKGRAGLAQLGLVTNLKSEPGLARAWKQVGYPSFSWVGLGRKWDFQARLGSGSGINPVSSLAQNWARGKNPGLIHPAMLQSWYHLKF